MISIIVPTRNERKSIKIFIEKLAKIKKRLDEKIELIVSDISTDDTREIARKYMKKHRIKGKVVKCPAKGKGLGVIHGAKFVKGDKLFMIDVDLQYPLESIIKINKKMDESDADVVLTKRLRKDPIIRRVLGYAYKLIVRLLFLMPYDTQSTTRMVKTSMWKKVENKIRSTGWSWDAELIYLLKKEGAKIVEVPLRYGIRKADKSKISAKSIISMFIEILRIRLRYL